MEPKRNLANQAMFWLSQNEVNAKKRFGRVREVFQLQRVLQKIWVPKVNDV